MIDIDQIYALEHSQYSEDNGLYPWHVGTLRRAVLEGARDCIHNNRQANKWQIVFVGPREECSKVIELLTNQKKAA